jgi:diacylglycerol kinase
MIRRHLKRLYFAFAGIWFALRTDFSYRWQFFGGLVAVSLFVLATHPLSQSEFLFLGLGWALVLITELQNTSFETALDRLHPELHDSIGRSKDMAAGAVLTAGFFLLFVMLMIVFY